MKILRPRFLHKKRVPFLFALLLCLAVLAAAACRKDEGQADLICSLAELRPNPTSGYYDAVVRLDRVAIADPFKDRFRVTTPSASFELAALRFSVEGQDPIRLEAGDTFIVPLVRPDWKLALEEEVTYCLLNFWEWLPPEDQWHPARSEAMAVAQSLTIANDLGLLKPVPASLPPDWELIEDKGPTEEDPTGSSLYQKRRAGRLLEQIEIQYTALTEKEKEEMASVSTEKFLSRWSECAKKDGRLEEIAGRSAVSCDLEGAGDFGWTYRYFYVDSDILVGVDIQSDPKEWVKPEAEKEAERKAGQVFLSYGYGPVGPEEWQVLIEIRMDGRGAFHKRSRAGSIIDKKFEASPAEFSGIEAALEANRFWSLESRSGRSEGMTSFIAVRAAGRTHTVEMKNVRQDEFDRLARTIRGIVLPKVGEHAF